MRFTKFLLATYMIALLLIQFSLAQNAPQDYVDAHNKVRAEVDVGPLTWNETVAGYAKKYANSRVAGCELEHSNGPYGENIAVGPSDFTGVGAVTLWTDEKASYDYGSNSCVGVGKYECMHYTQVVWRDSVHLGCARAKCHNGWWFVTCNYDPVGNIEGERPY